MRAVRPVLATQQIGMGGVAVPNSRSRVGNLFTSAHTEARRPRTHYWFDFLKFVDIVVVPLTLPLAAQKKQQKDSNLLKGEEVVLYMAVRKHVLLRSAQRGERDSPLPQVGHRLLPSDAIKPGRHRRLQQRATAPSGSQTRAS